MPNERGFAGVGGDHYTVRPNTGDAPTRDANGEPVAYTPAADPGRAFTKLAYAPLGICSSLVVPAETYRSSPTSLTEFMRRAIVATLSHTAIQHDVVSVIHSPEKRALLRTDPAAVGVTLPEFLMVLNRARMPCYRHVDRLGGVVQDARASYFIGGLAYAGTYLQPSPTIPEIRFDKEQSVMFEVSLSDLIMAPLNFGEDRSQDATDAAMLRAFTGVLPPGVHDVPMYVYVEPVMAEMMSYIDTRYVKFVVSEADYMRDNRDWKCIDIELVEAIGKLKAYHTEERDDDVELHEIQRRIADLQMQRSPVLDVVGIIMFRPSGFSAEEQEDYVKIEGPEDSAVTYLNKETGETHMGYNVLGTTDEEYNRLYRLWIKVSHDGVPAHIKDLYGTKIIGSQRTEMIDGPAPADGSAPARYSTEVYATKGAFDTANIDRVLMETRNEAADIRGSGSRTVESMRRAETAEASTAHRDGIVGPDVTLVTPLYGCQYTVSEQTSISDLRAFHTNVIHTATSTFGGFDNPSQSVDWVKANLARGAAPAPGEAPKETAEAAVEEVAEESASESGSDHDTKGKEGVAIRDIEDADPAWK